MSQSGALGCDFFVLLGDDITFESKGWKTEVEDHFMSISESRQLPLGCACVSFRDTTFPVFPTFPVMHRYHLDVFSGFLFPPSFVNQHGDPFLCNPELLGKIAALKTSSNRASVHTLIVVDNPGCGEEALASVEALRDWSPNHLVRVYVQPENMGASLARNAGMAQSFGDWTVLLDDDVIPEPDLLDAYLGAIMRFPEAKIYVGLTKLPEPQSLMQHSVFANPPWGVTANLCVEGRTNNSLWFSSAYPKSGGGEDVDYCLRMKNRIGVGPDRETCIVSVPEAVVHHPFWDNILLQIAGWARGDVQCLSALPHSTFYAPPNWAEFCMLLLMVTWWAGAGLWSSLWRLLVSLVAIVGLEAILNIIPALTRTPPQMDWPSRVVVAVLAIVPAMTQVSHDAMRHI
eukprot:gene13703-19599_t